MSHGEISKNGSPPPRRGRANKEGKKSGHRGDEAHQNAPGRPARSIRPGQARTCTHARDPGVASSDPQGKVSGSTRNSPGAPAEDPAARRTVTRSTRNTTAAHAAQDRRRRDPPGTTPHRGPEGVRRGARPGPQGIAGWHQEPGSWLASTCSAQPRTRSPGEPRTTCVAMNPAATVPRRRDSQMAHRERPDQTRHGATTRGHKAHQTGTPPATTTAQEQVPGNNGYRVPQTRKARTTPKSRHGAWHQLHWRGTPQPIKANSRRRRGKVRNIPHKAVRQDRRGSTPPKPTAGPSQDWRGTAPTGPSATIGEAPRNDHSQQQAPAKNGGELHPQGPPPGLVRDHPTKSCSTPQLGLAGNLIHRALRLDRRGTTHPIKAISRPQPGMAGNSTRRALSQNWRGTSESAKASSRP